MLGADGIAASLFSTIEKKFSLFCTHLCIECIDMTKKNRRFSGPM